MKLKPSSYHVASSSLASLVPGQRSEAPHPEGRTWQRQAARDHRPRWSPNPRSRPRVNRTARTMQPERPERPVTRAERAAQTNHDRPANGGDAPRRAGRRSRSVRRNAGPALVVSALPARVLRRRSRRGSHRPGGAAWRVGAARAGASGRGRPACRWCRPRGCGPMLPSPRG